MDADSNPLTTDEAGNARIQQGTVDMGAYEVQCPTFPHTVPASDVTDLVFSLTCANTNGAGTNDVINLTDSTYTLTAVSDNSNGNTGLPVIPAAATAGTLTINGNSATITRDGAASNFRFFYLDDGSVVMLDNLTLSNGANTNSQVGGAILLLNSTLTITNSTFSGNTAYRGGVIHDTGGTLTVSNSTFSGNSAPVNSGGAIRITTGSMVTISDSTFSGNSAYRDGGISNFGGTLTVTNSTFSGNSATDGGGISTIGGTTTVTNSTFSGNSATDGGGGIYSADGTTMLNNSIVANNGSRSCLLDGGTINAQNSLIEGGLTCVNGTNLNNLTGIDPSLGTLTGSPAYFPLNSDSFAINAGDNALAVDADSNPLTTDEAGNARIQQGTVDMGAYESPYAAPVPVITTQPQGQTIFSGQTTVLSVTASGNSLSYQWYEGTSGDTSIPVGTDSDTFTTPALSTTTSYWVRVSNLAGSTDSDTATVTIEGAPVITTQPQGQTIFSGQTTVLSVVASGSSLSYQWYQGTSGDTSLPVGTDSDTFTTPALTTSTSYWVRVSNPAGSADSDTATVTVEGAPTIITQPQSTTSFAGFTTLLSVTASGSSLSYQWYQGTSGDTSLPVGTDSDSFTTPALTTSTSYWVRVSNPAGSADSDTATVTVEGAPTIITQPQSTTSFAGFTTLLSVTASGSSLSYQWYQGSERRHLTPRRHRQRQLHHARPDHLHQLLGARL